MVISVHLGEARSAKFQNIPGGLLELSLLEKDLGKIGIIRDQHGDIAGCLAIPNCFSVDLPASPNCLSTNRIPRGSG